ncbi:MAG: universal stress protein [Saprospirales bacterium]|nr:MAG: universal stress protein [Saprospirales bacterium]
MKHAIIAIDLTSSDGKLLSYLKDHKAHLSIGQMTFVHVLPEKFHIYPDDEKVWAPLNVNAMDEIMSGMRSQVGEYFDLDHKEIKFHLAKGDPLAELVDCAEKNKADIVIIGQKTGVKKHGVLAKNLVRNVVCNGLVIPEDRPENLQHILVPVDFSPYSSTALKRAMQIAEADPEIKVTALHIYEMPALGYYKLSMTEKRFRNTIKSNIEDSLRNFVKSQLGDEAERITIKAISRGVPGVSNYLTEYALASNVDFVVMGAKGHSKLKLLLMGSVTEGVLSAGNFFPTLIVK